MTHRCSEELHFDPLVHTSAAGLANPNSYWSSTVDMACTSKAPLCNDIKTDVAIIGAGYTGLLTAYYLASEFNIQATVIEANHVGFGASGRNAGFVLKGSGRLSYSQMASQWGLEVTQGIYNEFTQAVDRVDGLINKHQILCEPQEKGYLKVAHNTKALKQLKAASEFISTHLGGQAEYISKEQFNSQFMNHQQAFGALRLNDGFGLNPLKLVLGYKRAAESLGVEIHEGSCIAKWTTEYGQHRLTTSRAQITAKKIVTAGNAYTPQHFHQAVDNRFLPILSNIIVTKPLTREQLEQAGLNTHQVTMDTRILKYYYRLLPDNRLLFGGRGAIYGKDASNPIYAQRLKYALNQCFPCLSNIPIDYNWTGWIAAALDDMPHVYENDGVSYCLGYCGSGVSFSAQAAYRTAQRVAGIQIPNLPLYNKPLPKFPLAKLRRLGQWGYYHYGWLRDRYT